MKSKILYGIIILALSVFILGCQHQQESQGQNGLQGVPPTIDGSPGYPIKATLSFSDKPLLNKPVTLTLKIKSLGVSLSGVSAKIELPDGISFISGDLSWNGDLTENEERSIGAVVKSSKTGFYEIKASALSSSYPGEGAQDAINVEVTENDAIIGSQAVNNWYEPGQGQAIAMPQNNGQIRSELVISRKPEMNREFTVTYRVTPQIDLPDPDKTQVSLVFPPKGFEIVKVQFPEWGTGYGNESQMASSEVIWKGAIEKGKTAELSATFKITETGWGDVLGILNVQPGKGIEDMIQDVKIAELRVDRYSGSFVIK